MAENPQLNKKIANIFASYLKIEFGWEYKAIGIKKELIPTGYPDVDEILDSEKEERLFLQCKRPFKQDKTSLSRKVMAMNNGKGIFTLLFEPTIEEFENKYRCQNKNISNIILLLHSDLNFYYFVPGDISLINKSRFAKGGFRGIYIISQKADLYKKGVHQIQKEFVSEVKSSFNTR